MAAYSSSFHYHASLLIDSSAPTTINNMCGSNLDQLSAGVEVSNHRQNIIQVSDIGVCNEGPAYYSVTEKNKHNSNMDSSSLVCTKYNIDSCSSIHITSEKDTKMDKKRKSNGGSYLSNLPQEKKQKKVEDGEENEKKSKKEKKLAQAPPGYVHVRARRGQATDSHSLAERVRREKISERMKLLQALVPGCQKVGGKALMLDEIINYVQSLQNQVEFLSMKLASVNPMLYDFGMDFESLMVKPDQELNSLLPSYPLPTSMQTCSPTLTTSNHYPIFMENSSANSLLFQHAHIPRALPDQIMFGNFIEEKKSKEKLLIPHMVINSSIKQKYFGI